VIWIHTPKVLSILDSRLTGGRVLPSLERAGHYLLYEPHPLVLVGPQKTNTTAQLTSRLANMKSLPRQIFFILLLSISEILFIPPAWPLLPHPQALHRILTILISTLPYIFLYLSCTRTSAITSSNHSSAMSAYPYDYTIFHPPSTPTVSPCRTCARAKPARSKHCSLCGTCIAKADHHCIWLNSCVGRNNYALFLLLLLSLGALAFYGAYLTYVILNSDLQSRLVPAALTRGSLTSKRWSTGLSWRRWIDLWGWVLHRQMRIGAVGLLAVMAGPLPVGLLVYHLYLIWAGMTTNESSKWADLTEDVADALVWKARREDVLGPEEREREEQRAKWPVRGKWVVVVAGNGEMPGSRGRVPGQNGHTGNQEGRGPGNRRLDPIWEKVTSLAEVENVYDLGFWENLRDVFFNRD
jgi:hypothetical protein